MKKILALILSFSMLLALTSCQDTKANEISLYDRGLELIAEIDMLSESPEYVEMMSGAAPIAEAVGEIGKEDFTTPKETYVLKGIDDILIKNLTENAELSDEIKAVLKKKMAPVLPSQINAFGGITNLASSNILIENSTFLYSGLTASETYLYKYTDLYSFMVTFVPSEDNIVTATASIIVNEELGKCSSSEELAAFFIEGLALDGITIEKLN